ncbi:hypothetical protein [Nitrosococcus halophilus]|uniref:hypothetical protein n=1 Tax=Nitrosococcus halophilus TaxID=133539 RepID=UPI0012FE80BE|nr:hypothetical protein [Nitrosococcus halophilus]
MTNKTSWQPIPTLSQALQGETVDTLKKLAKAIRKADLVEAISTQLHGEGLRTVWKQLDELQQAAVAEAVYSTEPRFKAKFFQAKYGKEPRWYEGGRGLHSPCRGAAGL